MTGRRIVSIWLPRFAIARWERTQGQASPPAAPWDEPEDGLAPDAPVILAAEGRHGPVIHAATEAALAAGAVPGTRVTDARAIAPDLVAVPADLAGDAAALTRLAHWARRWCPWSATDGADGLVLDVTGAAHLWGGEAAMLADMEAKLADLGQTARLAVAPTHGAAWALARHGGTREVLGPDAAVARLAMLPVSALRLDGETLTTLRRLGLKRLGDLMVLPRAAFDRRFGRQGKALATPLRRLDQALGALPEPVVSPPPPHRFRAVQRLPEPVMDPQPWLAGLFRTLCRDLERQGHGARAIRLDLFRTDGRAASFEAVTARASRDPAHLLRLLERRFESLDAGFGFDTLALDVPRAEPQTAAQARLDGEGDGELAIATLIDRLAGRIGAEIRRPDPAETHLPERAERWAPALAAAPGGLGGGGLVAPPTRFGRSERPLRMLRAPERIEVLYTVPEGPPIRFKWRRRPYLIRRHQGPERIAPEWWRAPATARLRDYYKVEVDDGARYWLFREGISCDGRGGAPDWFLHGLFA